MCTQGAGVGDLTLRSAVEAAKSMEVVVHRKSLEQLTLESMLSGYLETYEHNQLYVSNNVFDLPHKQDYGFYRKFEKKKR